MASVAHFDPQSEGLIAQIEVAACLVYRDHASANPVAINHLSLIIFSACQEGSIKSYDTNTLFPTAKYSGLVDKWQNSSIFLGEVKPNNVFNTSVNVLEVMEWLASEGYLFCRATMYELQARVGRPQEPTVPQVEAPLIVEKPISTKELNTLLTIIAVLCKEAKLDYKKHSKTAGLILSTAASMGFSIGDTTIENYLKKIPDALGARTK